MPYTINALENQVVITFTGMTLAEVQAYLAARANLLTALRWHGTEGNGPGGGQFVVSLHRSLTVGNKQALQQAMS